MGGGRTEKENRYVHSTTKSTMNNNDNVNRVIIIELLTQDLLF